MSHVQDALNCSWCIPDVLIELGMWAAGLPHGSLAISAALEIKALARARWACSTPRPAVFLPPSPHAPSTVVVRGSEMQHCAWEACFRHGNRKLLWKHELPVLVGDGQHLPWRLFNQLVLFLNYVFIYLNGRERLLAAGSLPKCLRLPGLEQAEGTWVSLMGAGVQGLWTNLCCLPRP